MAHKLIFNSSLFAFNLLGAVPISKQLPVPDRFAATVRMNYELIWEL